MGTHYKGTTDERRCLDALIKLNRAANSLGLRLGGLITAAGLTETQFGVLEVLYHLGPLCQRALGEKLLRTGGNVTMVIDHLEKRNFVRRERSAEDRRYITVHLTPEGRRLIARVFPKHVAQLVAEMSVLTPSEQEELGRLCRKLGKGIVPGPDNATSDPSH